MRVVPCETPPNRTDEDLWEAVDTLAARQPVMAIGKFKELEKAHGLNHNPHGILQCVPMRSSFKPITTLTYDPAHVWFASGGNAPRECHLMMKSLGKAGITWEHVREWLRARHTWPSWTRTKGNRLWTCFSEARRVSSKTEFKAGCTESVMIVPMLRHFLVTVVWRSNRLRAKLAPQIASFNALANVVLTIQDTKVSKDPAKLAPLLKNRIEVHMRLKKHAYGSNVFTWKDHVQHHVPPQVERDGRLLDSLPLERKHQSVKTMAECVDNTRDFDRTILVKAVSDQIRNLSTDGVTQMIGPSVPSPSEPAMLARATRWRGMLFHCDDIVVASPLQLGLVRGALQHTQDSRIELLVERLASSELEDGFVTAAASGPMERWRLENMDVRQATCWHSKGDGSLEVVL